MNHTFVALVENKPSVLSRVASVFRRRAFNIESLTVSHTDRPGLSRMTVVVNSNETEAERLMANLNKLVNVLEVADLSALTAVNRDLALIKVSALPQRRTEIMQLVEVFRARIVDVASDSFIVEITGDEDKISGFVEVLRPFGILEMVRTGLVAMARGTSPRPGYSDGKHYG